ncbi:cell envelope integrity protein TolA [Pseudomonas sp. PDM13]|uniref:cell envelope integrity protein TolA n=1 Tax=Pseudomonas sp. PDM13 TaxID=2769255 RepID=UPI0021E01CBB|nr:cell envelope integrity protein TolA [Pseudomonas sp. PDM13]MCU9945836.1 cell envelope integrity protein TolA [Pseudomonas sp. PDM13]
MQQQSERSPSESYFWPAVWAIGLHALIFGTLFVSFAFTPELPPSRPIVQATLYQLKSQSPATTQTNQKIAGEAKKTAAPQYETEQLEQKKAEQEKQEQQKVAAAKAAEQKKADEARKAEEAAEAKKADDAKKAEEAKKQQADIAKKKSEEEAKKKAAEEAKKKAAEEAKKKAAAEAAKKKAAEDAKKKAAAEAAKKKAAEEAKRKANDEKKAAALAELLSNSVEREATASDEVGDTTAGNYDDLIRLRVSELWTRPPSARNGMSVVVQINMLPDGTITNASISRSSGDSAFDQSAISAVKNVGRITEMQGMSPADFNPYRSFKMTFTPEDLAL